jgi:hypothetical protein
MLVSAHGTDAGSEVFEDLLDPAFFDAQRLRRFNLRPLDLLRTLTRIRVIRKTRMICLALIHCCIAILPISTPTLTIHQPMKSKTRSTRQIQGWMEVQGELLIRTSPEAERLIGWRRAT